MNLLYYLVYKKLFIFFLELNSYAVYSLAFFAYMVSSSLLLLKGLNNHIRAFLLPWLAGMGVIVLFLLVWSIWLLYGYYIYVRYILLEIPIISIKINNNHKPYKIMNNNYNILHCVVYILLLLVLAICDFWVIKCF